MSLKFLSFFSLIFIINSCSNCDFQIPFEFRSLIENYNVKDTLEFISNDNRIEKIVILEIDSSNVCGSFMTMDRKSIYVKAMRLSNYEEEFAENEVFNLIEIIDDKGTEKNLNLIVGLDKAVGELTKLNEMNWSFKLFQNNIQLHSISDVTWMSKKGLIRYLKTDGTEFKLKEN